MKAIKPIILAVAACVALCFTSCTKAGTDPEVGSYTCTVDVEVSPSEGAGIVFYAMRDAVADASRGFNVRTPENDSVVLAAADEAAKKHGDDSNNLMSVAVVFQPANGGADTKPIVLRRYTFVPVD